MEVNSELRKKFKQSYNEEQNSWLEVSFPIKSICCSLTCKREQLFKKTGTLSNILLLIRCDFYLN